MERLFDPLRFLTERGATLTFDRDARRVRLSWPRKVCPADRRKGDAVFHRFHALLALQLDVEDGQRPRTVQQLVASGRICVVNGRYGQKSPANPQTGL
jgi:hypothetical protein